MSNLLKQFVDSKKAEVSPPSPPSNPDIVLSQVHQGVRALQTLLEPKPGQSQGAVLVEKIDLLSEAVALLFSELAAVRREQAWLKERLLIAMPTLDEDNRPRPQKPS